MLGEATVTGNANDVSLGDGLAFVTTSREGIAIVDTTSIDSPRIVGHAPLEGRVTDVAGASPCNR